MWKCYLVFPVCFLLVSLGILSWLLVLCNYSYVNCPLGSLANFFFFFFCRAACRILVPQPQIKTQPPEWEAWNLNHWTAREFPPLLIFKTSFFLSILCELSLSLVICAESIFFFFSVFKEHFQGWHILTNKGLLCLSGNTKLVLEKSLFGKMKGILVLTCAGISCPRHGVTDESILPSKPVRGTRHSCNSYTTEKELSNIMSRPTSGPAGQQTDTSWPKIWSRLKLQREGNGIYHQIQSLNWSA